MTVRPALAASTLVSLLYGALMLSVCGGQVDDGRGGLSQGGNIGDLPPPGTEGASCTDYDAAAFFPLDGPPCDSASGGDLDCVDWRSANFPKNWGGQAICGAFDGQTHCYANPPTTGCNADNPVIANAFCRAWASQWLKGEGEVWAACKPAMPSASCNLQYESECFSKGCYGLCVRRDAGWSCESPCQ